MVSTFSLPLAHLRKSALLLLTLLICSQLFVSTVQAQAPPEGRPILFVHGWCSNADDWSILALRKHRTSGFTTRVSAHAIKLLNCDLHLTAPALISDNFGSISTACICKRLPHRNRSGAVGPNSGQIKSSEPLSQRTRVVDPS